VAGADRFLNAWHGRPSMRDRLAAIAEATPDDERADGYGEGERIARLEARVGGAAGRRGRGVHAVGHRRQQIALRIWCERKGSRTVAFHPTCHLESTSRRAISCCTGCTAPGRRSQRLIRLTDLEAIAEPVAALLLELPQREIGGRLPGWDDLVRPDAWARERGTALHMDGARLWQAAPFYGRPHAEIAGLFDSTYVSFYKDLGGLAGRRWRATPS
jgi:threonine aldolase